MVNRYRSPKSGVTSFDGIRENNVNGRTTDEDGRRRTTDD